MSIKLEQSLNSTTQITSSPTPQPAKTYQIPTLDFAF